MKRVLICANPDLNYIDGSSIWAQTIALAFVAAGARVDFLSRSKIVRQELFAPLIKSQNLTIIEGTSNTWWKVVKKRLSFSEMAELSVRLDDKENYDVIVVRGLELATSLLEHESLFSRCWVYLTDIPQNKNEFNTELHELIKRLATDCALLLCQTEGFKKLWLELVPNLSENKINLYTPVIPDIEKNPLPISERPVKAIYAGKFKGDWMTLEMAKIWPEVLAVIPDAELIMIGDKIHNENNEPTYKEKMLKALENTPKLSWLGAQSREQVQQELMSARVGLSWRSETMNDTVEYSTKILEYGGAGCAAIVNRNSLHESLLGRDYPLYANSKEEFKEKLILALNNDDITNQAASKIQKIAEQHTFSKRVQEIKIWMERVQQKAHKLKVLVAGHDLKFFSFLQKRLEATGKFEFLVDQWQGHNKHNELKSRELLNQADVIFCEWCLGNLQWYSHNKKPHQRLVARFHQQERNVHYLAESNWENIDHISYVSEFIRREGQKTFGFPYEKTSVIPNLIDENKFTIQRKTGDSRFTLGMIGVVPSSKRLDRAIDLLECLLEKDKRYCLRVKSKHPLDYSWLINRSEELSYYRNILVRINSNSALRHRVIFDPPGDDVNDWFTMVGYILSPSDFESFHMVVGEGMLTGTLPIIWSWDGAREIWPEEYVVLDIENAVGNIVNFNWEKEALENSIRNKLLEICNESIIVGQWLKHITT